MKSNMGSVDRVIRIIVALIIGYLYYANLISGTMALLLGVIAVAFVITSFINFCPLYWPFKFSTKKKI